VKSDFDHIIEVFDKKNSKLAIVDESSANRQLISSVVKGVGFDDVTQAASITDLVELLEVEPFGWILSSLFMTERENAMQVLELCSQHNSLKSTRITLLLDEDEMCFLPKAFDLGMLSWVKKPFSIGGYPPGSRVC